MGDNENIAYLRRELRSAKRKLKRIRRILRDPFAYCYPKLTDRQRQIAMLAGVECLSIEEIGSVMNLSKSSVGGSLHAIAKKLSLDKRALPRDVIRQIREVLDD